MWSEWLNPIKSSNQGDREMRKLKVLSLTIMALLAFVAPIVAQTETAQTQLISEHPAVQTAIQDILNSQRETSSAKGAYRMMGAGPNPVSGGGVQTPSVALVLNRLQFEEGQQLQSSLYVLPDAWFVGQVRMVRLMINIDTNQTRKASSFVTLIPGETIPVQNYIFDGSEPSGMYVYVVLIFNQYGQFLAQAGTSFVFQSFGRFDNEGHVRVDSAEKQGRYMYLKGNFPFSTGQLQQLVVIGKRVFPITQSNQANAIVDLGDEFALSPGIYDITLLVWYPGNTSYDSNTLPGGLKIFLPRQQKGG